MSWSLETVGGHPCDLFVPQQRHPAGFVAIYLHGVHEGRLSDHSIFTELFERHGLVVVGPRTKRSWWTNRICSEFDSNLTAERHLLDNVLPYIESTWNAKPPRIATVRHQHGRAGSPAHLLPLPRSLSRSRGHFAGHRFSARLEDPEDDDPLLEMYEDPEAARQETAILHIHPLNWPRSQFFCCDPTDADWFDSSDRLRMKLSSLGVPHECDLETVAGGHGFGYYNIMAPRAIQFLVDRLASEQLRVV